MAFLLLLPVAALVAAMPAAVLYGLYLVLGVEVDTHAGANPVVPGSISVVFLVVFAFVVVAMLRGVTEPSAENHKDAASS